MLHPSRLGCVVALVLCCEAVLASGLGDVPLPAQTEWQKALFKNVSERAAVLSQEAEPKLLAVLDNASFREELSACCPSVANSTARELLQILQDEMSVVEVASGFPSVSDTVNMNALAPGMSIHDGMNGSFFQSAWQAVMLRAPDPEELFHRKYYQHVQASCSSDQKTVTIGSWSYTDGCHGNEDYNGTFPLNECMHDKGSGETFRYTCNGTFVVEEDWYGNQQEEWTAGLDKRQLGGRAPRSPDPIVKCPARAADASTPYSADGQCHAFEIGDAIGGWQTEDTAEMKLYKLKPFAEYGSPHTLAEALERGPYALVNNMEFDMGSPLYGDVSAIFSARTMRRTAILSAIDTGFFMLNCAKPGGWFLPHDCSKYKAGEMLGTMQHFNHLILTNHEFWNNTVLAHRFARLEGQWGSHLVPSRDFLHYLEAVPAGIMRYPEDIRILIGSFPGLFGSAAGAKLREWAKERGWVLLWALGLNLEGQSDATSMDFSVLGEHGAYPVNKRLVDPVVLLNTSAAGSLPLAHGSVDVFEQQWASVAALRNSSQWIDNTTYAKLYQKLESAVPMQLRVTPLRSGKCVRQADEPECIGISLEGHCVCYSTNGTDVASRVVIV